MHLPATSSTHQRHTEPLRHPRVTPLSYHHRHVYDPVILIALTILAATVSFAIIAHCIRTMRAEVIRIAESVMVEKQALELRRIDESYLSGTASERNDFEGGLDNGELGSASKVGRG